MSLLVATTTDPSPAFDDTPVTCVPDLAGDPYEQVLKHIHDALRPQTYFEIGCFSGGTLALARCKTVAVDPAFKLAGDWFGAKPSCQMFQMTSDAFFAAHSPKALFGQPIDLAFLDGMHLAEFLLRDFINTERHCRRNSVVFLHDCIPVDTTITDRAMHTERRDAGRHPFWWAGDVWKVVVALQLFRPDLVITALDASPTGLIAVTNLDPESTVLSDRYFEIVQTTLQTTLDDYGIERYFSELNMQSTSRVRSTEDISTLFWL